MPWFVDIFCDLAWVTSRQGVLGPSRLTLRGATSASIGIAIDFHLFGDEQHFRHIRALLHTEDQQTAERCIDANIQTWVASLEVSVMMEGQRPFHIAYLPSVQFVTSLGHGDETSPALIIQIATPPPAALDYRRIAHAFAAWNGDVSEHLFYFRRLVDSSLPLDVRWLNGYRLLERTLSVVNRTLRNRHCGVSSSPGLTRS
jgi:hypothetical protein